MKRLLAIVLIAAGAYLFFMGASRRNSFIGHVDTEASKLANSVDANGGTSVPKHIFYLAAGAILVLGGVALGFRSGSGIKANP